MQEVKSDSAIPNVSRVSMPFLPSASSNKENKHSEQSTPAVKPIHSKNQHEIDTESHKNSALHHAIQANKMTSSATSSTIQQKLNDFDVVWAKMKGYPWWPALFFWTKQALEKAGFRSCFSSAFDFIRISKATYSDSSIPKECLVLFLDKFNFSVLSFLPGRTIRPFTATYDSTLKQCMKDLKMKRFVSKRRLFFIALKKAEILVHSSKMELDEDWNAIEELNLSECLMDSSIQVKTEDKPEKATKKEVQPKRIKRKRDASNTPIKQENVAIEVCPDATVNFASSETQLDAEMKCAEKKIEAEAVFVSEATAFRPDIAPLSTIWTIDNVQSFHTNSQDVVWDSKVYIETCKQSPAEIEESVPATKNSRNGREDGRACRKNAFKLQQLRQALRSGDLNPHTMVQCTAYADTSGDRDVEESPFRIVVHPDVVFICDLHAHLATCEIIGFLAGRWVEKTKTLYIQAAFPCRSLTVDGDDGATDVEMDPESELLVRNIITQVKLEVVGWYHSHPTFAPDPSVRDIENQTSYQHLFQRGCQLPGPSQCLSLPASAKASKSTWTCVEPFVGLIVGTYDPKRSNPVSLFRYFHTRADDCTSTCTTSQSICLPYEFVPSIPVHCKVLAEENRQRLLQATMYPSVYRNLFPFRQLQLVPLIQLNDESSRTRKSTANRSLKQTKRSELKSARLNKRPPKRNLLLPDSKQDAGKRLKESLKRPLQQSKKEKVESETTVIVILRDRDTASSVVKDDSQLVSKDLGDSHADQILNGVKQSKPNCLKTSIQSHEWSKCDLNSKPSLTEPSSELAVPKSDGSATSELDAEATKNACDLLDERKKSPSEILVSANNTRKSDSVIDPGMNEKMRHGLSRTNCGNNLKQLTGTQMDGLAKNMIIANISGRRRNRKASRPIKRVIDHVAPSISKPSEPHFVVFDESLYQKVSDIIHVDANAVCRPQKVSLSGSYRSTDFQIEAAVVKDESLQRTGKPISDSQAVATIEAPLVPVPSSELHLPLQHNPSREAGNHPSISPADRKSSTDCTHERDRIDGRRPQRRSSAKYGSKLGRLHDKRHQHLHSLRTRYGESIQNCVEQVVALIDYYCKFGRRTELHQIWKSRVTKIEKLEISLMENVKKLNLPVDLRVAFVKVGWLLLILRLILLTFVCSW